MVKKLKKRTKKVLSIGPLSGVVSSNQRKLKLLRTDSSQSETEKIKKTKIRVIGIGGGGGSIVSEIASRIKKASFVAANTDLQALKRINPGVMRFQFGQGFTQGLGTGMNINLAREAAQNEKERIKTLVQGQDLCILVASLGGGTGSGATPVFAKISRDLGNLTYGIFTLPFKFEGERKMEIARDSLERIRPCLNTFSIIPNERIFQIIDKTTPLKGALSQINETLAQALQGLIETIYQPGLINIDFADLRTILEGKGKLAYLNTTEVQGPDLAKEAVQKVISNPLYPYSISKANGILFNITGPKHLGLAEVSQISESISRAANKEAKIIFGVLPDQKSQDKIKITLLATGCRTKPLINRPEKKLRSQVKSSKPAPPSHSSSSTSRDELLKQESLKEILTTKPKQKKIKVRSVISSQSNSMPQKTKTLKRKKVKVQVKQETVKKETVQIQEEQQKNTPSFDTPKTEADRALAGEIARPAAQIRKNALQIKKEVEEAEKEILDQEKLWETPAFLRKKRENLD